MIHFVKNRLKSKVVVVVVVVVETEKVLHSTYTLSDTKVYQNLTERS